MNDAHDLGGKRSSGAIDREPNEPVFHHDWERRVFALTLAAGFLGKWNIDMSRWAREQMPGPEYLRTTYYEHWLFGLERLLVEKSLVSPEESRTARADQEAQRTLGILRASDVDEVLLTGASARRAGIVQARFSPGDRVLTHSVHTEGHTRLPRYARGKVGVIHRDHGVFVFPDTNAMGLGENPQHCYSVRFSLRELWGTSASTRDGVYIDLWEDYLEPA